MNKRLLLCLSLAALGCCLLSAESSALLSPKVPASDTTASSASAAPAATEKATVAPKTTTKTKAVAKKAVARTLSGKIVSIRPAAKGGKVIVLRSGKHDLKIFVSSALAGKLADFRVGRNTTLRYHLVAGERVALGVSA
jgi:hypothetical protein